MHHPDCDLNDPNIEGIRKPCNCPPAWSGGPTTDTAGPVGSLGVVGGFLPVSSAEALISHFETRADYRKGRGWEDSAMAFQYCANKLRTALGMPERRQPEKNA
jgi:hypothetical protein